VTNSHRNQSRIAPVVVEGAENDQAPFAVVIFGALDNDLKGRNPRRVERGR
jgi:hypothetical protein